MRPSLVLRLFVPAIALVVVACAEAAPTATSPAGSVSAPPSAATIAPVASETAAPVAAEIADVPFYRGDVLRSAIEAGPGPVEQPVAAWDIELPGTATVNPILVGGALITGTNDEVIALDAVTGERRWSTPIEGGLEGAFGAADGVIVAPAADAVHGLDAATGAIRWSVPRESAVQRPPIVDGVAYVGSNDGRVVGIDVQTGDVTWTWQGPRKLLARVDVVADGVAYVSSDDGRLFAVSTADGTERWTYQAQAERAVISKVGDSIYVSYGLGEDAPPTGQVVALDAATGAPRWRFAPPSGSQAVHGAVHDGLVYVTTRDDGMYALRDGGASMEIAWRAPDVPLTDWPGILSGDIVYVATRENGLYAVRATDGTVLWHTAAGDEGRGPIVSGGRVFQTDGNHAIAWAEPSLVAAPGSPSPAAASPDPSGSSAADLPLPILRSFGEGTTGVAVGDRADGPEGVQADFGPDGMLYVIDTASVVSVIDPSTGHTLRTWGGTGHGDGQFDGNHDLAVAPDGRVFITDEGGHRIEEFAADGTFRGQIGAFGSGRGQFTRPGHLDVGPDGSLYVQDGTTITRFGPDGNVDWRAGGRDDPNGQLARETYDLAVLPDGNVLVTMDSGGPGLVLAAADGSVLRPWGPEDLAGSAEPVVAPDGRVWLFEYQPSEIGLFTAEGARVASHPFDRDVAPVGVLYPTPVIGPSGKAYSFERDKGLVELEVPPRAN